MSTHQASRSLFFMWTIVESKTETSNNDCSADRVISIVLEADLDYFHSSPRSTRQFSSMYGALFSIKFSATTNFGFNLIFLCVTFAAVWVSICFSTKCVFMQMKLRFTAIVLVNYSYNIHIYFASASKQNEILIVKVKFAQQANEKMHTARAHELQSLHLCIRWIGDKVNETKESNKQRGFPYKRSFYIISWAGSARLPLMWFTIYRIKYGEYRMTLEIVESTDWDKHNCFCIFCVPHKLQMISFSQFSWICILP